MPNFQVQVHGQNFLVDVEGRVAKRGFLTHRVVDAPDTTEAENLAVQKVRETEDLRKLVKNTPEDPPTMEVSEMVELPPGASLEGLETGFILYEDAPKRWWQFWR